MKNCSLHYFSILVYILFGFVTAACNSSPEPQSRAKNGLERLDNSIKANQSKKLDSEIARLSSSRARLTKLYDKVATDLGLLPGVEILVVLEGAQHEALLLDAMRKTGAIVSKITEKELESGNKNDEMGQPVVAMPIIYEIRIHQQEDHIYLVEIFKVVGPLNGSGGIYEYSWYDGKWNRLVKTISVS